MNRRNFLKAGCYGAAFFSFSGLILPLSRQAYAATVTALFTARATTKILVDNTTISLWQFTDPAGGPGTLPSGLTARSGDTVVITLTNRLPRAVNIVIPGALTNTPPCAPGATQTYMFTAPAPGSYVYYDDLSGEIGRAMGLSGPFIVLPADGSNVLYPGGPAFNRQYSLTLNEVDTRLNAAIAAGQLYDMANYEPNYFFVNGLSFPASTIDPDTHVIMTVGERIALRFINAGLIFNPIHFHGYHVNVASRNRVPETAVINKDTVLVKQGECVDLILPVTQAGEYEVHSHYLPANTANGVYSNGAIVMLSAA